MGFQESQHGIGRLRTLVGARGNKRSFTNSAVIGFASCGEAHAPQSVRAQGDGADPDKVFHRQSAPKASMWRNTLWNRQPRHGEQIAAVEIIVQKCARAGVIIVREHQSSAVELYVVEQPSPNRRQIGNRLDVMITPTSEQPHPPAAALLAKEKYPGGLDQSCASFLLATIFLTNYLRCRHVTQVSF